MVNKRYVPIRVQFHTDQKKRIHNAVHRQKGVTVHFSSLNGANNSHRNTGIICLTQHQLAKVRRSPTGSKFSFAFSPAQVKANMKHEGGFLPILAAILAPAITGIIGGLAEKAISGSGLKASKHQDIVLHKKSHILKVTPQGKGLFLSPYSNYSSYFPKGHGLFLSPPPYGRGFKKINLKHLPHNHALKSVPFISDLL